MIAAFLGLVLLGSTPGAAAATEHHVQQSASYDQRHKSEGKRPFCGKGIIPLDPAYSKPSAPKSTKASATLLPCYKLAVPSGPQATRP
jgi:hypothetical protein